MGVNDISNSVGRGVPTPRDGSISPRKYEAEVMEDHYPSDGNKIRFMITELTPLVNGHMKNNPIPIRRTYTDARGRIYTSRGTHNNNFTAEYWSTDTYRKTPPNVTRGERIYVWQKADSDDWWWEPVNHDAQTKRRSETVIQSVNADKPTGTAPNKHDASNTYYTETSSHNKTWTVSTSKANGEYAAYIIQINAGDGSIVIKDDIGNHIELDSKAKKIWMRNQCQTEVTLQENNIKVHCNEMYNETIGKDMSSKISGNKTLEVSGNVKVVVNGSANVKIDGTADINVGGSTKLTCGNTEITGNVKIGQNLNVEGNVGIKGSLNVSGGTSLGGGGSVTGSMDISGNLTAKGPVNFPAGGSIKGYD